MADLDWAQGGDDETGGEAAEAPADTGGGDVSYDNSTQEPAQNFDAGTTGGGETGAAEYGGDPSAYSGANEMESANDAWGAQQQQTDPAATPPQNEMETANDAWNGGAPAGAETPSGTPADPQPAHAPAQPIDPERAIQEMVPPVEPAPVVIRPEDTRGAGPGPTAREQVLTRADIIQNYEDPASPGRLGQGDLANCGVVATLNAINRTPAGQAHLAREAEGGTEPPPGDGATGDPTLRTLESQTNYEEGVHQHHAMQAFGLNPETTTPRQAIVNFQRDPSQPTVLSTHPHAENSPEHAEMNERGIHPNHAYEVVGTYQHPDTGETMVIYRNPHGDSANQETVNGGQMVLNPRTYINGQWYPGVPISQTSRYFNAGTNARVPRR